MAGRLVEPNQSSQAGHLDIILLRVIADWGESFQLVETGESLRCGSFRDRLNSGAAGGWGKSSHLRLITPPTPHGREILPARAI